MRVLFVVPCALGIAVAFPLPAPASDFGPIQSLSSGKCIDLQGGSKADGPVVIQYGCHSGANQQWSFQDAGGAGVRIVSRASGKCLGIDRSESGPSAPVVQAACGSGATEQLWSLKPGGGGYVVRSNQSGRCLDVPGGSTVDGARIIAWRCSGRENQVWRLAP